MRSVTTRTTRAALLAAGFLVFACGTARAESLDVKIPFAFIVRGQTLPAGEYRMERESTASPAVLIRGEKGIKVNLFVMTMPATGQAPTNEEPVLIFTRDQNRYQLTDIWDSGQGREIVAGVQSTPR